MGNDTIRALLIGKNHNFEQLGPLLHEALESDDELAVTITTDWDELQTDRVARYDVVIDYIVDYHGEMTDDQRSGLLSFVRNGGGYLALHGATAFFGANEDADESLIEEHERMVGGRLVDHPGVLETTTEIVDGDHPITRGVENFSFVDEPYELEYDNDSVRVLAKTSHESFGAMPVIWTKFHGDGRVCYYSAGHDERALENPDFQRIIQRATKWVARPE